MRRALIAALLAGLPAGGALAENIPPFLEGTALFTRNTDFCPGSGKEPQAEGTLQVNRAGIFGYELGCTFLQFLPEKDPESDVIYSWVATASCGDDSGITRPDTFSLIHSADTGMLIVQSQTEYAVGLSLTYHDRPDGSDPFEDANWLSGTYALCPKY